jgi:hypothetical protein
VPDVDQEVPEWIAKLIPQASREFDALCVRVHESQDDPEAWLSSDTITDVMKGLADLANTARYTFMRIRILQERLKQDGPDVANEDFRREL